MASVSIPSVTSLFDLHGRIAVVTGGGRNIGRELVLALAEAGADVAILDVSLERAEAVASEVQQRGRRSVPLEADVSKVSEIERAVDIICREFSGIDILVNNAGIVVPKCALDITDSEWDKVFGVNLRGMFFSCQRVAKEMIRRNKGKIINIASIAGIKVLKSADYASYYVSKAGVIMLTRVLAGEWARHHIMVNAISPGHVRHEQNKDRLDSVEAHEDRVLRTPLARYAVPADLKGACVFLASEASDFVTGHNLVVDGGFSVW